MPDFSGASLKLKAEGEEKVLATLDRIDKKAKESVDGFARLSQDELDKAGAAYDRLYGKQSRAARQTQDVVEGVKKKVDEAAKGMSHSAAIGLGELARGFGRVAESGNLSAFAVREFTGSAFRLGNALGSAGLGAGVGLAAIAIGGLVEYFQSASKKADEMAEHYQKALDRIAHAGTLFQASQEEQFAFSGDPLSRLVPKGANESVVDYLKRTVGQRGLADEAKRLNAEIDKLKASPLFNAGAGSGRNVGLEVLENQLKEVNKAVGELGMNMAIADQRRRQLNKTTEDAARVELQKKNDKLDERSVAGYQNEELNRIVQRIKSSGDLTVALTNEHNDVVALRNEQALLRYELDRVNISVKDRIEKEKELARVTKELQQAEGTTIFMNGMNVRVNPKPSEKMNHDEYDKEQIAKIKESERKFKAEAERISKEIGTTLARGITDGIKTWFSGGGFANGFKALTASILDGLGQMFAQVAEKALIGSQIMQRLVAAIQSMNPWVAAVAAGALFAFGNSLRSGGSGNAGSGYGGSGGGLPTVTNTGVVTASAPQGPVTSASSIQARPINQNTFYVIGPDDPRAGRQIQQLLDNNARRG